MLDDNRHITRLNKFLLVFFFSLKNLFRFQDLKNLFKASREVSSLCRYRWFFRRRLSLQTQPGLGSPWPSSVRPRFRRRSFGGVPKNKNTKNWFRMLWANTCFIVVNLNAKTFTLIKFHYLKAFSNKTSNNFKWCHGSINKDIPVWWAACAWPRGRLSERPMGETSEAFSCMLLEKPHIISRWGPSPEKYAGKTVEQWAELSPKKFS